MPAKAYFHKVRITSGKTVCDYNGDKFICLLQTVQALYNIIKIVYSTSCGDLSPTECLLSGTRSVTLSLAC